MHWNAFFNYENKNVEKLKYKKGTRFLQKQYGAPSNSRVYQQHPSSIHSCFVTPKNAQSIFSFDGTAHETLSGPSGSANMKWNNIFWYDKKILNNNST